MADPASLAGTVVSGLAKVILGELGTLVSGELKLIYGAKDQFQKLHGTFSAIDALLLDAEEKQYNEMTVRNWLMNLKDVAYDIEDVLDLISTEQLERQVNPYRRLTGLYSRYGFAKQVKGIYLRLDEIEKNGRLKLQLQASGERREIPKATVDETASYIIQSGVFGRENDKALIISRLVSSESKQFLVLPITGMGGIGKTTLAQLVYNDPMVKETFDLRLWVYVPKKIVLQTVIGNIIHSVTRKNCSNCTLENLQNRLHEILMNPTFLLVLDDVWIQPEDHTSRRVWETLKDLLLAVGSSSAVLVTTRDESVVSGTMDPFKMKPLPEDDCWSIFVKSAFKEVKPNQQQERLGKSIVHKCKGVPLAVQTMGDLLRNTDVDEWNKIAQSELWEIAYQHGILPALKLSYDHTPSHLRSCFAYCAVFGKGYAFPRIDLVNIWMAQGMLDEKDMEMEDVGDKYFEELLSRSFFQFPGDAVIEKYVMQAAGVFNWNPDWASLKQGFKRKMTGCMDSFRKMFTDYRGKLPFVEMHDLFQDLAAYVAGEEIVSGISSSNCKFKVSDKARHIAWGEEDLSGKEFPKDLSKPCKVRTFAFLHPMGSLSKSFLESLLLHFKCLRVLMLLNSKFEELPDLIGDLKHLRYLDISVNSELKLLPNAISKLVNLQVLDVGHCNGLKKLPKDIHRLVSLRTLVLTSKATCLPKRGFECWSSLRILKITSCPNFTSLPKEIKSLKKLKFFEVERCLMLSSLPDEMKQLTNLEELSISHCGQLDLAEWKGLDGLTKLKYLRIYAIPKLVNFPRGLESVAGSLKHFRIGECKELRSLPEELQQCTSLSKLDVFCCDKPRALPMGIQALEYLQELTIISCSGLRERYERDSGADWHLISHIPYIQMDNQVVQDNRAASAQQ